MDETTKINIEDWFKAIPDDIPGWFQAHKLYRETVARVSDGAILVETGTFLGRSADFMGREIFCSGKAIRFDTWDNWVGVPPGIDFTDCSVTVERMVRERLEMLPVNVRTGDGLAAAQAYADDSIDLVFLDDDHSYAHVLAECRAWWLKVKTGGVLAGDDYDWESVRLAIDQWSEGEGGLRVDVRGKVWEVRKA